MRRLPLLLSLLLGAATSHPVPALADPAGATPFVSREGRFAAVFPAEPLHESAGRETWAGRMEEGSFELEDVGLRLRVEFHDVPRVATAMMSSRAILDLAKDGVVDDMKAHDVSVQAVSLHGHPGLALRYEPGSQPGALEEARVFLVGSRLYVAFARADARGPAHEAASRFLASFDAWEPSEAVASLAGDAGSGR
jgi:hypothetical protein